MQHEFTPQQIGFHVDLIEPLPLFRVEGDWPGGGFGYTLPFRDATAARTWGLQKAGGRADAIVTAQPRQYPASRLEEAPRSDCALQCICGAGEQDVEAMRARGCI